VAAHNFTSKGKNQTPDPVPPVKSNDNLAGNQFVADGDVWTIDE
jgi:hypothetical protein